MEPKLKVALCIRPSWRERPGGDVVQLLKTKEALESAHPVEASIVDSLDSPEFAAADLVHVFNVQQPEIGLPFLRSARERGQVTALSTIFWDLSHAVYAMALDRLNLEAVTMGAFRNLAEAAFRMLGKPDYYAATSRAQVAEMVSLSDVLLPNSREEGQMLGRYLGRNLGPNVLPVVNAVDSSMFYPANGERAGVIQAGNFEPVKNHMGTLRADLPITFVGNPTNARYVERLRRKSGSNVTLIDRSLPGPELADLYRRHRVHVNPSFRESPGLATMEALACGCRAVVAGPEYCPVDTYFGDLLDRAVFVCDPYSKSSISGAIDRALAATAEVDLTEWKQEFSWKETARQTYEAYRVVTAK